MRDFAIVFVNGQRHEVRGAQAFAMLSDYLRYLRRLTGTKVVCSEGDCGACAVLMGTPTKDGLSIHYRAVTSCIAMMAQLDGTHIVTVEGLAHAGKSGGLHPVQTSMVACNGAQCGFCTPGIVVAMAGMCEGRKACGKGEKFDEEEVRFGLTGNLCRCTGYEGILQAGMAVEMADVASMNEVFSAAGILPALKEARGSTLRIEAEVGGAKKIFCKPTAIADACAFKAEQAGVAGGCWVLSGGTDVGVLVNKGRIDPGAYLSMWGIRDFSDVETTERELIVGGGASLAALEAATKNGLPALYEVMQRHGSPLIRNAGTVAGNIVNGSPIGDTMPALMVLNAEVELTGAQGSRRVNMNDFYVGYRKTVLKPDEVVTRIFIPRLRAGETLKLYKISKRWDLDISTFTAAFWIKSGSAGATGGNGNGHAHGPVLADVRIAYGGVGPMILRLPKTEAVLKGHELSESLMAEAGTVARTEIAPISDVRAAADYRLQLGENVLLKLYYELAGVAEAVH